MSYKSHFSLPSAVVGVVENNGQILKTIQMTIITITKTTATISNLFFSLVRFLDHSFEKIKKIGTWGNLKRGERGRVKK